VIHVWKHLKTNGIPIPLSTRELFNILEYSTKYAIISTMFLGTRKSSLRKTPGAETLTAETVKSAHMKSGLEDVKANIPRLFYATKFHVPSANERIVNTAATNKFVMLGRIAVLFSQTSPYSLVFSTYAQTLFLQTLADEGDLRRFADICRC
jgi:hypothetical protein